MVRFVYITTATEGAEIFLLPSERREARERLREAGLESIAIREGEPGEAGTETGEILMAADGPGDAVADLPSDREIAEWLGVLINPESSDEERMDVIGAVTQVGAVRVRSFEAAGVLTSNAGFVITIGPATFQVTVVS